MAARPVQRLADLVLDALAQAAAEEIDLPHIVVCYDPVTEKRTYTGPYPDLQAALAAAEDQGAELNTTVGPTEPRWQFHVAALYPPTSS